ncbi:pseudouridine-5'-phosphate glycosidase [Aestuariivirga litoralis]|uniref:pseudouridine-5'-phosphate glycosidase n=1 Tax=Aestuariivirga litoralis TaxID=2650924 RepID=UPI0018C4E736|nr:pseudouridine-5'-phosphate glycosidase [Aestuariivirga litoralis]MBG1231919.1 pseudouridine-5'-phosphate glycosidase [Aestuariivirga litoralis]
MKVKFSAPVKSALQRGGPVVALESTIIAHGMPFPQNLEMAEKVEALIKMNGATPATIAIIDGELRAGLNFEELIHLSQHGTEVMKVSTRDLPFVVAKGMSGATTVASTMCIAALAGIAVFATGGIGGVHRGAEETFDVSADLTEFATSNVAVVTAGAKAILDLGLTLEKLETLGVPVVGYGTDEFPAFYSRKSGFKVPMRMDSPKEVAQLMKAKWKMGLQGGVVVANPIQAEAEIPSSEISPVIEKALTAAKRKNISGKETTPFLLKHLAEATQGRSLKANIALVENNAVVAARIAVAYSQKR